MAQATGKIFYLLFLIVVLSPWISPPTVFAFGRCPCLLRATRVTATSALLRWRNSHHDEVIDYKVKCKGIRQYTTSQGHSKTENSSVHHYVPGGVDHVLLSNLQPNYNYSCAVVAEIMCGNNWRSKLLHFTTLYAVPQIPRAPSIQVQQTGDGSELSTRFEITLHPVSTKYGPISGYEVQFHALVSTASYSAQDDQIPYLPPQLVRPTGSQLISLDAAQRSLLPHSFRVQYDTQSVLPASINIGSDLMGTALKNGTAYSVINVAYTYKEADHADKMLFSASQPSVPFTAIGDAGIHSQVKMKHAYIHASRTIAVVITTGGLVPAVIITYMCCVGAFVLYKEYQNKWYKRQFRYTRIPLGPEECETGDVAAVVSNLSLKISDFTSDELCSIERQKSAQEQEASHDINTKKLSASGIFLLSSGEETVIFVGPNVPLNVKDDNHDGIMHESISSSVVLQSGKESLSPLPIHTDPFSPITRGVSMPTTSSHFPAAHVPQRPWQSDTQIANQRSQIATRSECRILEEGNVAAVVSNLSPKISNFTPYELCSIEEERSTQEEELSPDTSQTSTNKSSSSGLYLLSSGAETVIFVRPNAPRNVKDDNHSGALHESISSSVIFQSGQESLSPRPLHTDPFSPIARGVSMPTTSSHCPAAHVPQRPWQSDTELVNQRSQIASEAMPPTPDHITNTTPSYASVCESIEIFYSAHDQWQEVAVPRHESASSSDMANRREQESDKSKYDRGCEIVHIEATKFDYVEEDKEKVNKETGKKETKKEEEEEEGEDGEEVENDEEREEEMEVKVVKEAKEEEMEVRVVKETKEEEGSLSSAAHCQQDRTSQISSLMFLPRGFSSGPRLPYPPSSTSPQLSSPNTLDTAALQHSSPDMHASAAQSSGLGRLVDMESGEGEQTDHAPELEMDLLDWNT